VHIDAADLVLIAPLPSWRRAFFPRVVGELGFHYVAVERALLVEQGRRGRAEAVRAVVAAEASIAAHVRSALFGVLSDIGMQSSLDVQQIADLRRAISAFGVGLAPSATESDPRSRAARGKCLARHRGAQWMGYA
jgi:hypothetical protein